MNLKTPYGPLDEASRGDGDLGFIGVNETLHPAQLPAGYVSRGKNVRFRRGRIEARPGITVLRCGKTDGVTPWSEVYGVREFYDTSDNLRWIVVAADSGIWRTRPNNVATAVDLPVGETVTAANFKMMFQAGGSLLLLRGADEEVLATADLDDGLSSVVQTPEGEASGTDPIPASSFGLYFGNRAIVIVGRDNVAVSDIGDYTRYQAILQTFKINEGDFEDLVAIAVFNQTTLIFLKENSVWSVQNVYGDLSAAIGPLTVTDQYGCVAPGSVVRVGSDLFWWSQNGLVSLRLTEQNEVQAKAEALTWDMDETVGRINQLYIDRIQGASDGKGFIYFAVPLDEAKVYGESLVPGVAVYDGLGQYILTVELGKTYRYVPFGTSERTYSNNGYLSDGDSEVLVDSDPELVLIGPPGAPVQAQVKVRYAEGANTAVMVYDTKNNAWAGVDESAVTCVKGWFKVTIQKERKLAFLGYDGLLHVYGGDQEDEVRKLVSVPYVDVLAETLPAPGQTIQVNGGATLAASTTLQDATHFLATTLLDIQTDNPLWASGTYGFNPTLATAWSAPNTTPSQIAWGVRFLSTDGTLPTVTTSGTWAFKDAHSGQELQFVPVATEVVSRGYQCQDVDRNRYTGALLLMSAWAATYTVSTITDGVARELVYQEGITLSRTQLKVGMGGGEWDTSNDDDDHGDESRGDYSVVLPDLGMNLDPSGVNLELHQDVAERVPVDVSGHWLQLKVSTSQGRVEIRAMMPEALADERVAGMRVG